MNTWTERSESQTRGRRIDAELAAINVLIPRFNLRDPATARLLEKSLAEPSRAPIAGVSQEDRSVRGCDGNDIPVRVYRPLDQPLREALPVLVYIHGGAFILGGLHTEEERCRLYAAGAGCVVVALDYRLAPEYKYPSAINDCMDVVLWVFGNAQELHIDDRKIAVGGNSAGGALAASVALTCRDTGQLRLIHQLLINPALDARSETYSMRHFVDTPVWTREDNLLMWETYLGHREDEIRSLASPAQAPDVSGVASASIWTAEYDPLRDEGLSYASRLLQAGVSVALYQYPGTFHGFDSYRMTLIGQRALADQVWSLQRAFTP